MQKTCEDNTIFMIMMEFKGVGIYGLQTVTDWYQ